MIRMRREQEDLQNNTHTVEGIVAMLIQAVKSTVQFVKELAIRKARQWTQELMESYRYVGTLKKRFSDCLEALTEKLTLEQKKRIWEFIEQFLESKTTVESVT